MTCECGQVCQRIDVLLLNIWGVCPFASSYFWAWLFIWTQFRIALRSLTSQRIMLRKTLSRQSKVHRSTTPRQEYLSTVHINNWAGPHAVQRRISQMKAEMDAANGLYEHEREAAAERLEHEKKAAALQHAEAAALHAQKQLALVRAVGVNREKPYVEEPTCTWDLDLERERKRGDCSGGHVLLYTGNEATAIVPAMRAQYLDSADVWRERCLQHMLVVWFSCLMLIGHMIWWLGAKITLIFIPCWYSTHGI